jgi:hypothetical protein
VSGDAPAAKIGDLGGLSAWCRRDRRSRQDLWTTGAGTHPCREFDGDVHRDRDVFVADVRRQNALVAAGWTVLRFTSADVVGRPHEVVAAIRRALA